MGEIRTVGIVGGGVAGLAAGVLLSRHGLRVKLYEANAKIGGCCATTELAGYTFDDGAMFVAIPGVLDRAFERLGLDRRASLPLRRIDAVQTARLPDGTLVTMGADRAVRIVDPRGRRRDGPLASDIDRFMRKWQPVLRLVADELIPHPLSVTKLLFRGWRHLHKFRGTVATELERMFDDPALRAAMSGAVLFSGLPPEKAPVFQILALVAMLDEGFYLPEGGMGAIAATLGHALRRNGAEIFTGAPVERIELSNGRVCGLKVRGQGIVPVDAVVSSVSGMLTFGRLLEAQDVPASMARKAKNAPLSHRALSVQLGLANRIDVPSHSVGVLPMMDEQYRLFLPADGVPRWFNYAVPTVAMPELAPPGGSVVEMFPPIDPSWPIERWTDDAKEAAAASAIAALAGLHELDIVVQRVLSPKDFRDRMHLFEGALYGLSPAAGPGAQFPHRTPIDGLFQAGQTTYPGYGVGTSMLSGIFAAEALMRRAGG